jgi:hypothetical protein
MNNLKFGVLMCGLLGLVACFIPEHGGTFWDLHKAPTEVGGGVHVYMVMGAFAASLLMGLIGAAKPPFQRWQGIVALLGFAFVLFKMRKVLSAMVKHGGISGRMMIGAAVVGVIFSFLTLAKPETAR